MSNKKIDESIPGWRGVMAAKEMGYKIPFLSAYDATVVFQGIAHSLDEFPVEGDTEEYLHDPAMRAIQIGTDIRTRKGYFIREYPNGYVEKIDVSKVDIIM